MDTPVTARSLNGEVTPALFRDNSDCNEGNSSCAFQLEADGFSRKLTARARIDLQAPTHSLEIVVADEIFEDFDPGYSLVPWFAIAGAVGLLGLSGPFSLAVLGTGRLVVGGMARRRHIRAA